MIPTIDMVTSTNDEEKGPGREKGARLRKLRRTRALGFRVILAGAGVLILTLALGGGLVSSEAQQKKEERSGKKVRIREEKGPAGHTTIGIDEDSLVEEPGKELALTFSTLMAWDFDAKKNTPPPASVKKLDGHRVKITGFMYPLEEGSNIRHFCLLRTTQTCCYGPRPQYNQYLFVEMARPTPFRRLDPVTCVGKLRVEPNPEEGYIYRLEGEVCEAVTEKGS